MSKLVKIGIIGTSHVGAHVADALLTRAVVDELYLCDVNVGLCRAQVNDLLDTMSFYPHAAKVFSVDDRYEQLASCDIIVNAAGHVKEAMVNRDGELFCTTDEAKTFVERITHAGFAGIWVSVANPNDVVATEIWKLSGCDPTRVIGSGTTLDSARLKHALSRATGYAQHSINAWMLGEHGVGEFACWSHVSFGCLTPDEVERQTNITFDKLDLEDQARKGGYVTAAGKQCTEYSIANGAVEIIRAIVHDTKLITPVSTLLHNVYGYDGFFSSLPCVLGEKGVEQVFVPEFDEREVQAWKVSSDRIRNNIARIGWLEALM